MGVFLPQLFQQLRPGGFRHVQRIEQAKQVAHVADFQHPLCAQRRQRLRRQTHRLLHLSLAHSAQHLQTHLGDLFKGVAFGGGAVDVLVVVVPQRLARRGLRRLGDGQSHVRLERQQTAVEVGKGDDLLRRQKAAVLLIQTVLLEPSHVVLAAACRLVQAAQCKGGALLWLQMLQTELHFAPSFPFPCFFSLVSFPAPAQFRRLYTQKHPARHPPHHRMKGFCSYFTLSR